MPVNHRVTSVGGVLCQSKRTCFARRNSTPNPLQSGPPRKTSDKRDSQSPRCDNGALVFSSGKKNRPIAKVVPSHPLATPGRSGATTQFLGTGSRSPLSTGLAGRSIAIYPYRGDFSFLLLSDQLSTASMLLRVVPMAPRCSWSATCIQAIHSAVLPNAKSISAIGRKRLY